MSRAGNRKILLTGATGYVGGRLLPMGFSSAIAAALRNEDQEVAATRWCDAQSCAPVGKSDSRARFATRIVDSRQTVVHAPSERAFMPIQCIGGVSGWYCANFLWKLRGRMDLLVGGVGFRRGRRDPTQVRVGDVIDFWRVESYEPGRLLRLRAEMKLPGRAWLQFEAEQEDGGRSTRLTQTALFDPRGLTGLAYWYLLRALHALIFSGMLNGIRKRGENPAATIVSHEEPT